MNDYDQSHQNLLTAGSYGREKNACLVITNHEEIAHQDLKTVEEDEHRCINTSQWK